MEELVQLGAWSLRVDREASRAAYERASGSECECSGCLNYRRATKAGLPSKLLHVFDQLAIDPAKPAEVYDLGPVAETKDQLMAYGGFYHVIGRIENDDGGEPFEVDENWKLTFSEQIGLPESAFKRFPLIQVEFDARLPWKIGQRDVDNGM